MRTLIDRVMFILHSEHEFDITDTIDTESGMPYETSHTGAGNYKASIIIYWNEEKSGKIEPTVIKHTVGFERNCVSRDVDILFKRKIVFDLIKEVEKDVNYGGYV
jgi:transcription initiation factor IIF auxiliary subunit